MPVREVESDLYYSQTSVSFRLSSPKDSTMQSTPSPFTFAEIIGLTLVLEKEAEPRPVNLLTMKLIRVKNHAGIPPLYDWKP